MNTIERLAKRVRSGQVVFFVGAGFSIDSERNSAVRMVARLFLRFRAMVEVLGADAQPIEDEFFKMFPRGDGRSDPEFDWDYLNGLAGQYYEVNDAFCCAYEKLLLLVSRRRSVAATLRKIHRVEADSLSFLPTGEVEPLAPIGACLVKLASDTKDRHEVHAGKALFLDTQGFHDHAAIMGGDAEAEHLREVVDSYRHKLFPRHHVLARLAREGWCPLLLTTNFDRLLEGGFRLAGFRPQSRGVSEMAVALPYPDWSTVTSPVEFFQAAGSQRTALVVKIHGCAKQYARLRSGFERNNRGGMSKDCQRYLRSMVFTYREIQNWRTDTWARDYIHTLLRTKVMVFCVYSARDPVIHDTMRSVYEEMAEERLEMTPAVSAGGADGSNAPAYFFVSGASGETREFYSSEVLRAASRAADNSVLHLDDAHPNQLPFHFRNSREFPNLDEQFQTLLHLALRDFQRECLVAELRPLATLLLGEIPRREDVRDLVAEFDRLVLAEKEMLGTRVRHADAVRWTYEFHPGLLREFACVDANRRQEGPGPLLRELRAGSVEGGQYYFPATAQPGWTAWAVVVELALRGLASGSGEERVVPATANRPTVLVAEELSSPATAVTIHLPGLGRGGSEIDIKGVFARQVFWRLNADHCPWPGGKEADGGSTDSWPTFRREISAPAAGEIWAAALGRTAESRNRLRARSGFGEMEVMA